MAVHALTMSAKTRVFVACAPEDEPLRARLEKHLSPLERSGEIAVWHTGRLLAGDVAPREIEEQLATANVILLIVTPDLLASDALYNQQMRPALERRRTGSVRVIPILAKPCAWRTSGLDDLEPLPKNRTPITLWSHPDEAWAEIVDGLSEVLTQAVCQLQITFPTESEPQSFRMLGAGKASFFRLHVLNKGPNTARSCVAELLSVKTPSTPQVDMLGKPMLLKWAHEADFSAIEILPGRPRRLDLFFVREGGCELEFLVERPVVPDGTRSRFPLGNYLVEVRVTSRDASSRTEVFRVESNGDWRSVGVRNGSPDAMDHGDSTAARSPRARGSRP